MSEKNVKWELFCDSGYYDLFCVRPIGEFDFNSPRSFHFIHREDAEKFKELAEKAIVSMPFNK
jgi:hypothetical protein